MKRMKRMKHVWEKIIDPENIRTAIIRASEKKKDRPAVQRVLSDINRHVRVVHDLLRGPIHSLTLHRGSNQGWMQPKGADYSQTEVFPGPDNPLGFGAPCAG